MANLKSNVFCPNCGAKNTIEQNFCRFCGLNLQETTKSLVAQVTFGKNANELKQLRLIKKFTELRFKHIGDFSFDSHRILCLCHSDENGFFRRASSHRTRFAFNDLPIRNASLAADKKK